MMNKKIVFSACIFLISFVLFFIYYLRVDETKFDKDKLEGIITEFGEYDDINTFCYWSEGDYRVGDSFLNTKYDQYTFGRNYPEQDERLDSETEWWRRIETDLEVQKSEVEKLFKKLDDNNMNCVSKVYQTDNITITESHFLRSEGYLYAPDDNVAERVKNDVKNNNAGIEKIEDEWYEYTYTQ